MLSTITSYSHPEHIRRANDFLKWRTTYEGGDEFVDRYLKKFSRRETKEDFELRKALTPIPTFAKAAIKDVRNSIFQRMSGVSRIGGSIAYQNAVRGYGQGVDNRGSSMTSFIGRDILDELLVMGQVGIYVDAPREATPTLRGSEQFKPYLYSYRVEDIVNWKLNDPSNPSEFQSLILREYEETYDEIHFMPRGMKERFRKIWINEDTGRVNVQFINSQLEEGEIYELNLTKIPFTFLSLGDSLIKDVANHQISLLNLWSSNVFYAAQAGFPIYVEQRDGRTVGGHLKKTASDGSAMEGGQKSADEEILVGVSKGRSYDIGTDRPGFIHPSSEPLISSMELCDRLKKDVRELINLAVVNLGVQASAESKNMDNSGLEAGLSYIGLVLEAAEREIARHWAAYESTVPSKREVASINYPSRWNLKTDQERIKDATDLHAVVNKLPSRQAKKETTKILIESLLGQKVSPESMAEIFREIDESNFTTGDPDIIEMAKEQGLLGARTGAAALGFDAEEADLAAEEHVQRLAAIAAHQTQGIQGARDTQESPKQNNREAQETNEDEE